MKRVALIGLGAVLAATSCSGSHEAIKGVSTTIRVAPGFRYTDCSRIRPGDGIDSNMTCDPKNAARIDSLDCAESTYFYLRRPGDDLEGMVGKTKWQKAGVVDPATVKTPFAARECTENDY